MFLPAQDSPALSLDMSMRDDLAKSLERLHSRAQSVLPREPGVERIVGNLRTRRVRPGVFARYYDLITALQKQDWAASAQLWNEIAAASEDQARFDILPFNVQALGDDAERFWRFFTTGAATGACFNEPVVQSFKELQRAVPEALSLLDSVDGAWAAEIRSLITQVIAMVATAGNATTMSGGSSMMTWGAVLINVATGPDRIQTLSVLAHEATHLFLFGVARSEPLVTNPVSERYSTQLRPTPRPMNALYHSTYVSGRLHVLFEILLRKAELSAAERTSLDEMSVLQKQRFEQGCSVILQEAKLTPLGRRLIEEARDTVARGMFSACPER